MKTQAELAKLLEPLPVVGSVWKHYRGGVYEVVGRAIREADLSPGVLYYNAGSPHVTFFRPWAEWEDDVGGGVKRFTWQFDRGYTETEVRDA